MLKKKKRNELPSGIIFVRIGFFSPKQLIVHVSVRCGLFTPLNDVFGLYMVRVK